MGIGAIVAIYAALVATVSVGWQAYVWHRGQRTQLQVLLRGGYFGPVCEAQLVVRNLSGHTVGLRSVRIMPVDLGTVGSRWYHPDVPVSLTGYELDGGVPRQLEPHRGADLVIHAKRRDWVQWIREQEQSILFGPGAPAPPPPATVEDTHPSLPRRIEVGVETDAREWFWSEPFYLHWR